MINLTGKQLRALITKYGDRLEEVEFLSYNCLIVLIDTSAFLYNSIVVKWDSDDKQWYELERKNG